MKSFTQGLLGVVSALILSASISSTAAKADNLIASFDYALTAHVPYETGLKLLYNGPQYINRIRVVVYGQYCNLISTGLEFTQSNPGVAYVGQADGAGGFYVNATVAAVNYQFQQSVYSTANCKVELWATNSGGHGGGGNSADVVRLATSLSTEANLLSITIKLTPGYESLRTQASDLASYAKYLLDSANGGQSHDRLASILKIIKDKSNAFESAFIPVQVSVRNQDAQTAWLEFTKSLDAINL